MREWGKRSFQAAPLTIVPFSKLITHYPQPLSPTREHPKHFSSTVFLSRFPRNPKLPSHFSLMSRPLSNRASLTRIFHLQGPLCTLPAATITLSLPSCEIGWWELHSPTVSTLRWCPHLPPLLKYLPLLTAFFWGTHAQIPESPGWELLVKRKTTVFFQKQPQRLCLILQLFPFQLKGAELLYQTDSFSTPIQLSNIRLYTLPKYTP